MDPSDQQLMLYKMQHYPQDLVDSTWSQPRQNLASMWDLIVSIFIERMW
jgi:hypothetical protein